MDITSGFEPETLGSIPSEGTELGIELKEGSGGKIVSSRTGRNGKTVGFPERETPSEGTLRLSASWRIAIKNKFMWLIPLSLLIVFEMIADVLAKEWSLHGLAIRWIGAIVAYVIANSFWLFALKNGSGLGRGAIIFSVASAIIATIISIIFYKENISTLQIIGIIIGIISIILIFWEGE